MVTFTVYINQAAIVDLNLHKKLDIIDFAIFDYIKGLMLNADNMEKLNYQNETYVWMAYSKLLKDMPILKFKQKASITIRLKKIEEVKLIKTRMVDGKVFVKTGEMAPFLVFRKEKIKNNEPLVKINDTVSLNKRTVSLNKLNNSINTSINNKVLLSADADEPFSFKNKLTEMKTNKGRHIQIIALFWETKGYNFENKEQYQSALKRELKPARMLVGYSDEKIKEVMEWLEMETDMKWTLETVHKFIDDDLSNISPIKSKKQWS